MSVSTPENQGWGPSLLGDSWGSESQLHRGRAVNVGATQKTSSPPGLLGMVACGSSEACGWPNLVCTWWPGVPGGNVAELVLLLPVSMVLLVVEGCHLVDTRMGVGPYLAWRAEPAWRER